MLWVRAVWGTPAALLTGLLLASDPSFIFVTRHDWGSVALALMCRGAGLWLLSAGWGKTAWHIALGGYPIEDQCLHVLGETAEEFIGDFGLAVLEFPPPLLEQIIPDQHLVGAA